MNDKDFEQRQELFNEFGDLLLKRHRLSKGQPLLSDTSDPGKETMRLGRFVRVARQTRNLTQKELALIAGMSQATLMALETGILSKSQIEPAWVDALADALGENPSTLRLLLGEQVESIPPSQSDGVLKFRGWHLQIPSLIKQLWSWHKERDSFQPPPLLWLASGVITAVIVFVSSIYTVMILNSPTSLPDEISQLPMSTPIPIPSVTPTATLVSKECIQGEPPLEDVCFTLSTNHPLYYAKTFTGVYIDETTPIPLPDSHPISDNCTYSSTMMFSNTSFITVDSNSFVKNYAPASSIELGADPPSVSSIGEFSINQPQNSSTATRILPFAWLRTINIAFAIAIIIAAIFLVVEWRRRRRKDDGA